MPNKIIVEIEALDYTITQRDVEEALKSHFPYTPTVVRAVPQDAPEKYNVCSRMLLTGKEYRSPLILSRDEAQRLADEYNQKYHEHLIHWIEPASPAKESVETK